VPAERHRWARLTLEAHLIKLAGEGRAGMPTASGGSRGHEGTAHAIASRSERAARRQMGAARHIVAAAPGGALGPDRDNGAGKTQLLKLLSGDVWPTPPAVEAIGWAGPKWT